MDWKVELPKAVREIPSEELERYVRVFEGRPTALSQGCRQCALGAMAGIHDHLSHLGGDGRTSRPFLRYLELRDRARHARRRGGTPSPYRVIEDIFELYGTSTWGPLPSDPRLAIYEACVVELARRDSESTAPAKEAVGVGVG